MYNIIYVISEEKMGFLYGKTLIEVAFGIYRYIVICVKASQRNGISEAEKNFGYIVLIATFCHF